MQMQLFTKRLLLVSFFLFLSSNFTNIAVAQSKVCSWSGTWQTNEGTLLLTQDGDSLKGNFKDNNNQFKGISVILIGNFRYPAKIYYAVS